MSEAVVDDIVAVLPPLLQSLEALSFVARYLNPPDFDRVMDSVGQPDQDLRAVRPRLEQWPAEFADIKTPLGAASDAALAAFAALRVVQERGGEFASIFRALRYVPRAQEALYALKARLPPVREFFVEPSLRTDTDLAARLAAPANPNTGIFHNANEPGSRGAILVAPTATGNTWALMGEDTDTPNLMRILESVRARWNIDPERMLLTGMSDGGTFCYVTGFDGASPFTHLAPVSATFHPLLAEMADADRLRGLPIHIVHGRLDWMFPVQVARQTSQALSAAGANVTYRELDDLSHCYPREMNAEMLQWLDGP
jgi:phospholipase/carboxylesterase